MRTFVIAGAVAFGALALAACGGGGGGTQGASTSTSTSTTTTTTTASSGKTVTVSESEYKLSPSPLTISKAGTYTIEAKNDGTVDHALTVEGNGLEETRSDTISPGQSATITVTLKAGTYRMYCPIDGHQKLGMHAKLIVSG
jgi:uncharacterized cupredoxin-like copper-binding protein